jgi:pilus assembly protein CpaF
VSAHDEPFVATPMLGGRMPLPVYPSPVERKSIGVQQASLGGGRTRGAGEPHRPVHRQPHRPEASVLGRLAPYVTAATTDLLVDSAGDLWVDEGGALVRAASWVLAEPEVRALAVRLIAAGGRHVDEAHPCVDVRLADGIRVHVVLPPISTGGTLISIRMPRRSRPRLDELGMVDTAGLAGLRRAVARRENILITGAAGAGKTTLLAALLAEAPPTERIVLVEDVAELSIDHPHVVGIEARQPNLEGAGGIGLDALVREALRMRPDRLVVGECRGPEVRELLGALNTGHDGGAGTLHANSLADVPARLEALGALAGMTETALARQAVSAIHRVVHVQRDGGRRRVAAQGRLVEDARGRLAIEELRVDEPSADEPSAEEPR